MFSFKVDGDFVTIEYKDSDSDLQFSWEPRKHVPEEIKNCFKNNGIYFDNKKEENAIEFFNDKIGFFSKRGFVRVDRTDERIHSFKKVLKKWYNYAISYEI